MSDTRTIVCASLLVLMLIAHPTRAQIPFDRIKIDDNAGDVKMVGDFDGDGYLDVALGGAQSERLVWYRYPDWHKTIIATPFAEFSTDGKAGDIDGDGDIDIVVPDGSGGDNLLWFENPLIKTSGGSGDPTDGGQWVRHEVGAIGDWGKDVQLADFDQDRRMDIAVRRADQLMIFFQNGNGSWTKESFFGGSLTGEGMAEGDIDGDGDIDLVLHGYWLRNPGGAAARDSAQWTQWTIADWGVDNNLKAVVADLNQNGRMDVLFSSSESISDVVWYEYLDNNPRGTWVRHLIAGSIDRAHTLQVADMDLDGDFDVVVGQMHTSSERELAIYENVNGNALTWNKQVIDDQVGVHNAVIGDIDADGDWDIFGTNWIGNPPAYLWRNRLDPLPAQPDPDDTPGSDPDDTPHTPGDGVDSDFDGVPDNEDLCPFDQNKVEPGACGCGELDTDADGDGVADCLDACPDNPNKVDPGACGCDAIEIDTNGDGVLECVDDTGIPGDDQSPGDPDDDQTPDDDSDPNTQEPPDDQQPGDDQDLDQLPPGGSCAPMSPAMLMLGFTAFLGLRSRGSTQHAG